MGQQSDNVTWSGYD